MFGTLFAVSKRSATAEPPTATPRTMPLMNPRMREARVPIAMLALERAAVSGVRDGPRAADSGIRNRPLRAAACLAAGAVGLGQLAGESGVFVQGSCVSAPLGRLPPSTVLLPYLLQVPA